MCGRYLAKYSLLLLALMSWTSSTLAKDCVGVVAASATPFWLQVEAGARQAAKEQGLDMYFRGPSREGRVETQLQMIDWVLQHGCKALVIAPSGVEIIPRMRQLAATGLTTLYFDRDLPGSAVRGVVATDNFQAGVQAGRALALALGGQGNVALLRLQVGVQSTGERERGFRQGAQEAGLSVLLDTYVGEDSQAALEALRGPLPQLAGVFTPNSTSSRAVLAALRRLGMAGEFLHVGFDADDVLLDALRQGDIHSLMIQQAYAIGYQAVQMAAQGIRGTLPLEPVNIALQAQVVSRENLAQWEQARESELAANR